MEKIILLGLVMLSVMVSVTVYANEKQDEWIKNQMVNEQNAKDEKEKRDNAFLASPIKNFFLGSLKFKANYGRSAHLS